MYNVKQLIKINGQEETVHEETLKDGEVKEFIEKSIAFGFSRVRGGGIIGLEYECKSRTQDVVRRVLIERVNSN